jgi:glutamate carboxypeptidase
MPFDVVACLDLRPAVRAVLRSSASSIARRAAGAASRIVASAALVVAAAGPMSAVAAPKVDPALARIAAAADAQTPGAIDLLQGLVLQNSGTFNKAGVEQVAAKMESELQALGFTTRRVSGESRSRGPHLVAERAGKRGARVLMIGHMDTVFEPFHPFKGFARDGDRVVGPGTNDMKGGLVVMVAALRALKAAGKLDGLALTIVLTGDEEAIGEPVDAARADMIAAAKNADYGLCFESGMRADGKDYVSTARRGSTKWHLKSTGRPGHSSQVFSEKAGDGAIYEMSRVLSRFNAELREPNLTYSVGLALGGANIRIEPAGGGSVVGKPNIIPAEAEAIGDIRALTPEQLARVEQRMQAIVAKSLPGTSSTIEFDESYPPMAPTPGAESLAARFGAVSEQMGLGPVYVLDPMMRGAGDSAFISPYVATITGLGLVGGGSHAAGEWADLAILPTNVKRAAGIIYALGREPRPKKAR